MESTKKSRINIMTEGGIMIALATILSMVELYKLPYGGAVTLLSMMPILIFAYRHGTKWGLLVGFTSSLLQLLLGLSNLRGISVSALVCSVILDYLVAFTVLAVAGLFKGKKFGLVYGTVLGIVLRFCCHFITGVVIWKVFAPVGMGAFLYSFIYNGSYMGIELVTHTIMAIILSTTGLVALRK